MSQCCIAIFRYTDMESEDYSFYKGLVYLVEHHVDDLGYELTFSTEVTHVDILTLNVLQVDDLDKSH